MIGTSATTAEGIVLAAIMMFWPRWTIPKSLGGANVAGCDVLGNPNHLASDHSNRLNCEVNCESYLVRRG